MKGAIAAVLAIVLLFVGLAVGTFVPQIHQAYTTETRTVLAETTLTESDTVHTTQTLLEHISATRTLTVTSRVVDIESSKTTVTQTLTKSSTDTIATTIRITVGPEPAVVVIEHRGFLDKYGYYTVMGVVQNQDIYSHAFVRIDALFYDNAGGFVGTDFTYSDPGDLQPGQKGTFECTLFPDEGAKLVATYELMVSYD